MYKGLAFVIRCEVAGVNENIAISAQVRAQIGQSSRVRIHCAAVQKACAQPEVARISMGDDMQGASTRVALQIGCHLANAV